MRDLILKLEKNKTLSREDFSQLLTCTGEDLDFLFKTARAVADKTFGKSVYIRGLIEFTNYCKNDCKYCGIRRSNTDCSRYRLSEDEILGCCDLGYKLGFRTFVLQGGEDSFWSDDKIVELVTSIKSAHPDCAVTLSIGEKSRESYEKYFAAGADRYLLRHETINPEHYGMLHPSDLSIENRVRCLNDLKDIGFQTGCGIMVGSPYQTVDNIIDDLYFMADFKPHMIGIGPFIPHKDTPFKDFPAGTVEDTLRLLAIIRLMHPKVLLPATTALGTIDPTGREKGILAGANVIMPNLSPTEVRGKYTLYDGKICVGDDAALCQQCLSSRLSKIGYNIEIGRGDAPV